MDRYLTFDKEGFYYHYKHDPTGSINNYAYEVVGVGRHTEEENYVVIYRPLYKNTYLDNADFSARPLEMFVEHVTKDGTSIPRFQKITDPEVISELKAIRGRMYQ